jgi:UDP-N-acetylglucosamine 2-epimerase (non-hydrolysing)
MPLKVMSVFGTRPEAIKMARLVNLLEKTPGIESIVCVTGQHRSMLDQVLSFFGIDPRYDLDIMEEGQGLPDVTARALRGVFAVLREERPDMLLVQGDTNTTFSAALAAYYAQIPVGHIEAGLRTGNRYSPWPEEMNRLLTGALATLHFAPTPSARDNLLRENVDPTAITVTGNTGIDALMWTCRVIAEKPALAAQMEHRFSFLDSARRLILVTGHRRENFGSGVVGICKALARIAERDDVEVLYPVHLNPNVTRPVAAFLANRPRIHLIEPIDYPALIYCLQRSYLVLTDSGGIQEEAPSLGKPVLVMRDTTERPEGVAAGTAKLVGTDPDVIVREVGRLLDDDDAYATMSLAHNPFGDGRASERIVQRIREHFVGRGL